MKRKGLAIIAAVIMVSAIAAEQSYEDKTSLIQAEGLSVRHFVSTIEQRSSSWQTVEWESDQPLSHAELQIESNADNTLLKMTGEKYITRVSGFIGMDISIDDNADVDQPVWSPSVNGKGKQRNLWNGKAKEVVLPWGKNVYKELTIVFADETSIQTDRIVTLSYQKIVLERKSSLQLTAQYTLEGVPMNDVVWTVDKSDIASVDVNGNVKAIKEGNAKVRATTTDGRGLYAECEVTVTKRKFGLNLELKEGWNWISTNLSGEEYEQVYSFIEPIQADLHRFVGFESELIKDNELGFVGQLERLSPVNSYQAQMTSGVIYTWNGYVHEVEETPVTLKKGWNWLGYVPVISLNINEAFKALPPQEGDIVKSYDDFAIFEDGKWNGTLEIMKPGMGYMYFSRQNTAFHYPSEEVITAVKHTSKIRDNQFIPWETAKHKYPHNMSIIAAFDCGDVQPIISNYIIGAFVGNECRGIGKPVDGKLFVTIYGDTNFYEQIRFRAYDQNNHKEYEIMEKCQFSNSLKGTMKSPFILTIDVQTGLERITPKGNYTPYIDTSNQTLYLSGEVSGVRSVSILSSNGCVQYRSMSFPDNGINVSQWPKGVYHITIMTSQGIKTKSVLK